MKEIIILNLFAMLRNLLMIVEIIWSIYFEKPEGCSALCIPYTSPGLFACNIDVINCPLTEKIIKLSKSQPFSYFHYIFNNWEEFIAEHSIISDNIYCVPSIRNTFIYSSIEKSEGSLTIKGEWCYNSEKLTPKFAAFFTLKIKSPITKEVTCTYNFEKKTEFDCNFKGKDLPSFEDQIVKVSDNFVYKIEKQKDKEDDEDKDGKRNGSNYIAFKILILFIVLLFL